MALCPALSSHDAGTPQSLFRCARGEGAYLEREELWALIKKINYRPLEQARWGSPARAAFPQ